MEVEACFVDIRVGQCFGPQPVEVTPPQPPAVWPDEHETLRPWLGEPVGMVSQVIDDHIGDSNLASTGVAFGLFDDCPAVLQLGL